MTLRLIARCVFAAVLAIPAVALARQTFKPAEPLHSMDFKTQTAPELSIATEPGDLPGDLPVKLHHLSGIGDKTFDARAHNITMTYTKTGLSVELTNGTFSSTTGPWRSEPQPFQTIQLEFASNGEMLWTKVK